MLVCTTGCSGVANLRSPPQARSTGVPPSLDAPRSTSLSRSQSRSLLTCNSADVSPCTYLVVAKNNIRPPCLNFAVYSLHVPSQASPARRAPGRNHYTIPVQGIRNDDRSLYPVTPLVSSLLLSFLIP